MAKGRHQKDKLWLIHSELSSAKTQHADGSKASDDCPFTYCAFTGISFKPNDSIYADEKGYVYKGDTLEQWRDDYTINPVTGEEWNPIKCEVTWTNDEMVCPLTSKVLNGVSKVVMNRNNGIWYSFDGLKKLCKGNRTADPMDSSPLDMAKDLIVIHDPQHPKQRPSKALTKDFLDANRRHHSTETRVQTRPDALAKRILESCRNEVQVDSKRSRQEDEPTGYVDPLTGERKLIKSQTHTVGTASASLTSTAVEPEYKRVFKYLSCREYRDLIYRRMEKRRKENSEAAISLKVGEDGAKVRIVLFAWKFPETVHQLMISFHKNFVSHLRRLSLGDLCLDKDCVWFDYRTWFDQADEDIERISAKAADYVADGAIFRLLDYPEYVGICLRGFPSPSQSLHVLGELVSQDLATLRSLKASMEDSCPVHSSFVHSDPFPDCELMAIEEYQAKSK